MVKQTVVRTYSNYSNIYMCSNEINWKDLNTYLKNGWLVKYVIKHDNYTEYILEKEE